MSARTLVHPENMPAMIFFHVGWMKRYRGADEDDPTIGPQGYLENHRFGHECFNFFERDGQFYGYVPISGIGIGRIGARRRDLHVDDVTCVWFAKHPSKGRHLIVGWYGQARVFRKPVRGDNQLDGRRIRYLATTRRRDCTLVPVRRREFPIPTRYDRLGGFGQSPVWYGDDEFRREVWDYIEGY